MSLYVDTTVPKAGWTATVADALRRICDCWNLEVDTGTGEIAVGVLECACYAKHRAGCNLVANVVEAPEVVWIRFGYSSAYMGPLSPEHGIIYWDPEHCWGDVDVLGNVARPPFFALAHELAHAWGDYDKDPTSHYHDEELAVCVENQVRVEHAWPQRKGYVDVGPYTLDVCTASGKILDTTARPCLNDEARPGAAWRLVAFAWERILAALRRWGWPRSPRPPGPPVEVAVTSEFEWGVGGLSFDELLQSVDSGPARRVRAGISTRNRAPHRTHMAHYLAAFDQAPRALVIETVTIAGPYGVILLLDGPEGLTVVTDFAPADDPHFWVSGPGDLIHYDPGPAAARDARSRLDGLRFTPATAAEPGVVDGTVQFATLKLGDEVLRTALHGFRHPGLDWRGFLTPRDPRYPLWHVVEEGFAIWRSELLGRRGPGRVIARL